MEHSKFKLASEVAYRVYELGQKQKDIASDLGVSAATVAHLKKFAESQGMVHHRVTPIKHAALAHELNTKFVGVTFHVVHPPIADFPPLSFVADHAAFLLMGILKDRKQEPETHVGIAGGRAVAAVVDRLWPAENSDRVRLYAMDGFVTPHIAIGSAGLTARAASTLRVPYTNAYALAAPKALGKERWFPHWDKIAKTAQKQVNVALIGVGARDPSCSSLPAVLEYHDDGTIGQEAIGDVRYVFFDRVGEYVAELSLYRVVSANDLNKRLKSNDTTVIVVAAGAQKAEALLGALRYNAKPTQRCFNHVVTDAATAEKVRDLSGNEHAPRAQAADRTG